MISCRRTEIQSAHLALKGRPTVGDKGLKTPSSADNRLIDTTQTAREESEIFIRKPEVCDQNMGTVTTFEKNLPQKGNKGQLKTNERVIG